MARVNKVTRIKSTPAVRIKRPKFVKTDEYAAVLQIVVDGLDGLESDENAQVIFEPTDSAAWNETAANSVYKFPAVSAVVNDLQDAVGRGIVPIMEGSDQKVALATREESPESGDYFAEVLKSATLDEPVGILEWTAVHGDNSQDVRIVGFATKNHKAKKSTESQK
jgi:hypothetical protein